MFSLKNCIFAKNVCRLLLLKLDTQLTGESQFKNFSKNIFHFGAPNSGLCHVRPTHTHVHAPHFQANFDDRKNVIFAKSCSNFDD